MNEKRQGCKAKNARGEPCQMSPSLVDQGTLLCRAHSPTGHEEMARRGKLGGKATKEVWKRPGIEAAELGDLACLDDAQRWLRIIAGGVVSGRLDRGDASASIRAIEVWIRAQDSLTEAEVARLADKLDALGKQPKLRQIR